MENKHKVMLLIIVILLAVLGLRIAGVGPFSASGGKQNKLQIAKVNRGHLRIESLHDNKIQLKSLSQDPFDNPLTKKIEKPKPTPAQQAQAKDLIDINQALKREQEERERQAAAEEKAQADYERSMRSMTGAMRLKALASTGDRKVAVVEYKGKSGSVFVGSAVGSFIVTDIDDSNVYLQNFDGYTAVLTMERS